MPHADPTTKHRHTMTSAHAPPADRRRARRALAEAGVDDSELERLDEAATIARGESPAIKRACERAAAPKWGTDFVGRLRDELYVEIRKLEGRLAEQTPLREALTRTQARLDAVLAGLTPKQREAAEERIAAITNDSPAEPGEEPAA